MNKETVDQIVNWSCYNYFFKQDNGQGESKFNLPENNEQEPIKD